MKIFARAHKNTVRLLGRLFVYPGKISIRESNVNSFGIVKPVFPLTTSSTVSNRFIMATENDKSSNEIEKQATTPSPLTPAPKPTTEDKRWGLYGRLLT
ncbi:uncharacterized protein LOC117239802 isoform X3 [Bombus vosnesenskii]|uniref:Uncharacterized protein LOC117239802 isoform X3 n=1 Tax=Bombus vosnesenskii TaxID=207650 RepID=A0A6J3L893_9HYME|nr:uncharacterized protein LOC117239802 isoform X3 [Bombus vosnesenskii]